MHGARRLCSVLRVRNTTAVPGATADPARKPTDDGDVSDPAQLTHTAFAQVDAPRVGD